MGSRSPGRPTWPAMGCPQALEPPWVGVVDAQSACRGLWGEKMNTGTQPSVQRAWLERA